MNIISQIQTEYSNVNSRMFWIFGRELEGHEGGSEYDVQIGFGLPNGVMCNDRIFG